MPEPTCSVQVPIPSDHPAFAGHFPGNPLLPGVVLLAQAQEALLATSEGARWFSTGAVLTAVKFLAPVRPGAALEVRWSTDAIRQRADVQVWRHAAGDGEQALLACTAQIDGITPANP
ncbi:MAG: hypothetical protein NVS2B4_14480 [Ramlibacter sp.]